jgi:ABC-2 type transport system permease protein
MSVPPPAADEPRAYAVDGSSVPRRVPAPGGLNLTFLRIEIRRVVRNRRTVILTIALPAVFYLIFGAGQDYSNEQAGHGNVAAYIMVSMALYGAMLATTSGGAMVSIERAAGWSRQLRLTPLTSGAYVLVKVIVALLLGLVAVVVVNVAGAATGADMSVDRWAACFVLAWLLSAVFAAFGLFMGYLLPSENVMQILGPGLALLAFGGGLFVPLQEGTWWASVAQLTPMYGISELAHEPLLGGSVTWGAVANVVVWGAVFVGGAMWRFRRDAARV